MSVRLCLENDKSLYLHGALPVEILTNLVVVLNQSDLLNSLMRCFVANYRFYFSFNDSVATFVANMNARHVVIHFSILSNITPNANLSEPLGTF